MGRGKKYQPEQVVNLLRQIEVAVANGKTTALACKEAGIVEQTYFRWRKEYGGLQVDQAKRLKELEQENSKLKRLVANLSLDNLVLKDFASGNFYALSDDASQQLMHSRSMGSRSAGHVGWPTSHAARSAIVRSGGKTKMHSRRRSSSLPVSTAVMGIAGSRRC